MPAQVSAVIPDPTIQGLYYAGTRAFSGCEFCATVSPSLPPMGLYAIQRRTNIFTTSGVPYKWSFEWVAGETLENREISALARPSAGPEVSRHLYLGTNSGGAWDGTIEW